MLLLFSSSTFQRIPILLVPASSSSSIDQEGVPAAPIAIRSIGVAGMEDLDEGFGLYRSDSFRRRALGRSLSSRMLLESSVSSECALIAKYERLSQSMRSPDEPPTRHRRCGIWRLLADVLLARRAVDVPRKVTRGASVSSREFLSTASSMERNAKQESAPKEAEAKKKTRRRQQQKKKKIKRRSSWLPDPERRWPIQGW